MKIRTLLAVGVVSGALAALLMACGMIPNPAASVPGVGTLSCKIDGADWSATTGTVVATVNGAPINTIVIGASNSTAGLKVNSFNVVLQGVDGGTYALDHTKNVATLGSATESFVTQNDGGGTFTISKMDSSTMEGTFQFVAQATVDGGTSTVTVTDGKFSCPRVGK